MSNSGQQPTRSDEPIWWALFSAGGVCFAVVIPGAILAVGVLYPLGLIPGEMLGFERIRHLLFESFLGFAGFIFVGVAICLPLFHAFHRIRHGLHDLQWAHGWAAKSACYGSATLLSVIALGLWVAAH
ncbi:MAG: fumarate reductase subunit FrdD [Pseudohongiella sp.]|nr:fumarate reductase subunit FrdD [Pseudohongiella sp.]MDP2127126.1 fumarate reductase subunit FrdD [Pseudohongiella sp.]